MAAKLQKKSLKNIELNHKKYYICALKHWLHSLMDRTTDFGSVGEGSNPSAVTNNQSKRS